ncbi:hypothetical protein JVU11DRAFT_9612 [Chiua virens]|nr:hypothetical protein JVU11DRAFT_9612 [Chiua virens]
MPVCHRQSHEDFTTAILNVSGSPSEDNRSQSSSNDGSDSSDLDKELQAIRSAIVAASASANQGASAEQLQQVLVQTQSLLIDLRGKYRVLHKQNQLLENQKGRGKKLAKGMTDKELAVALKVDNVRFLGRKYSITHCLWVNTEIFPLTDNPRTDPNGKERWLSARSIEDGVKTELFAFVPCTDWPLMTHKNFGSDFSKGVGSVRSEMVSDVKMNAGTVFSLPSHFFGQYTKFAPILFPNPNAPQGTAFLKTAVLVKILKVALFGKSSLSHSHAPGPKTKAKIWELRHTTAGMIAAAAIVGIFILSGDKELLAKKGDKSGIPYLQYHNFYHQRLLSGTSWSRDVFHFFNDSLFGDGSSELAGLSSGQPTESNDWEEEFERAMLEGDPLSESAFHRHSEESELIDSECFSFLYPVADESCDDTLLEIALLIPSI